MVISVGINGFGRIGRVVFRTCIQHPELQITAINDPAIQTDYICYLIKFDSTHGRLPIDVAHDNDQIIVNGQTIKVYQEKVPSNIPWQDVGVQYVVEATGLFTNLEKASGHLASSSVKRVVVTSPSVDIPMTVLGVNCRKLRPDQKVISCASSTLYCLAPIMKILEDNYGVTEGFITSIHAMTPSLKPLDGVCLKGKHWRDHRSIHQNIIPASTGACRALGKIIPSLRDKIAGMAFRVPIVNVSVLDITVRLVKSTSIANIIRKVEIASKAILQNIIKISNEETVSSDFIGDDHSCILDAKSSQQLNPNFFKLVCWYENEHSYACRVINTILFCEHRHQVSIYKPKLLELEIDCNSLSNDASSGVAFSVEVPNNDFDTKEKPFSPYKKFSSKRSEISRIRSDSNKSYSTGFPSISSMNANENVQLSSSTKEKLECVKKEFTRMISITEDLLRKTKSSKVKLTELDSGDIIKSTLNDFDEKFKQVSTDRLDQSKCKTIFDGSKDFRFSLIETKLKVVDSGNEGMNSCSNIGIDISDINKTKKNTDSMNSKTNSVVLDKSALDIKMNKTLKSEETRDDTNEYLSEGTVINESNDKISVVHCSEPSLSGKKDSETNPDERQIGGLVQSVSHASPSYTKYEQVEAVVVEQTSIRNDAHFSRNYVSNFVYVHNNAHKMRQANSQKDYNVAIDKFSRHDLLYKHAGISPSLIKKIVKSKSRSYFCGVSAIFVTPKHFRTPKLLQSISSVEASREKDALFDKLDSVSTSGSETSVQSFETKSQVINVLDLAKSLEDLDRLDKLCRIIEISDELSDKLLSKINSNTGSAQSRKWSFKDLCERIKLDEFCNNLMKRDKKMR